VGCACIKNLTSLRGNRFAQFYFDAGSPFPNLVGFVDGHFQRISRPGGMACVNDNLQDHQTFSAHHRDHGLTYQAMALPNGVVLFWGPWMGRHADANILTWSNVSVAYQHPANETSSVY
jgi:hypothetical protein